VGIAAAFWYLHPISTEVRPIDIEAVSEFAPRPEPYRVRLEQVGFSIFVVNTGEEILAFEPRTPATFQQCYYVWVEANGLFEDPVPAVSLRWTAVWLLARRNVTWTSMW
jgi:hypothetical protein